MKLLPLCQSLFVITFAALPSAAAEPLSLDEAVRLAITQNPSQEAAREAVAASAAVVERARADRRPSIEAVAGAREFETHAFLPSGLKPPGGSSTIGPTEDWSLAVEGRWLFYDSGRGNARVDAAKASHAAARHELASSRTDLVLAVHGAYRTLQAALAAREAAASRLVRAKDHVRLAQRRMDAGASPPADVTRARVEEANARAAVAAADGDVRINAAALNTLMGRPAEDPVEVRSTEEGVRVDGDLDGSIRAALEQRPEILAARERVAARKAEVSLARATSAPTADLRARYGVRDEELFPSDTDRSIGINISAPLFDGGRERAEVARARAEARREEAKTASLENEVRREVVDAHARLIEMRERVDAAEAALTEARESVRLMRARYEAGASPIAELLDAASDLDAAEAAQVAARMNVQKAAATLAHARGDLANGE